MASEWSSSTVGALCDSGLANLQTGPFGSQLHAHDYREDGIAVVPTEAIRNRRIDHSVLPKVSATKSSELARHRLKPGDILFARRGVQATGHVAYVRDAEAGFLCGTGAILLRVNAASDVVTAEFLSHVFADPASVEWFKFHAIGATMPNLNESIIRSFPLRIPPLSEQRAVAQILSTLDDKIELNRRMNETLEAIARALFKSWFVDFDPVRAKVEPRSPGVPQRVAELFPDRFDENPLGQIPAGWQAGSVDDEFALTMGQSPPGETYNNTGEGLPFYQGRSDFGFRFPARRVYCTASTRIAKSGDTLVSVRAPVGDINMADEECAIGRGVAAVRHRTGAESYTYLAMHFLSDAFRRFEGEGTVFGSINKKDFHDIPIVVPPVHVVNAFENLVSPLDDRVASNVRETGTLALLRDTLLPKLISGELRIKDAERFLEKANV